MEQEQQQMFMERMTQTFANQQRPESSSNSTTATSAAFNRNSREPPVPSFSGENEHGMYADFLSWLPQFEECAAMFEYTDQGKAFWLKQKLTHSAASFVQSQSSEVKSNYNQMIQVLSSYFKDTTSATMRYKELFSCKQEPSESITAFGEHLSESMRRAERIEMLSSDVAKKHLFIAGVHDSYKAELISKMDDTTSFDQLCEIARNLERNRQEIQEFQNNEQNSIRSNSPSEESRRFPNNQNRPVLPTIGSLLSNTSHPVCYYCAETHQASSCGTYPTIHDRKKTARDKNLCFNCLKPNHIAKNCLNRKSCLRCRGRHHTSLCSADTQVFKLSTSSLPQGGCVPSFNQRNQSTSLLASTKSIRAQPKFEPSQDKNRFRTVLIQSMNQSRWSSRTEPNRAKMNRTEAIKRKPVDQDQRNNFPPQPSLAQVASYEATTITRKNQVSRECRDDSRSKNYNRDYG